MRFIGTDFPIHEENQHKYEEFGLTLEQFKTVQHLCSGAELPCEGEKEAAIAASYKYMADRSERLINEEADRMGFCCAGIFQWTDETAHTTFWYETTSGTVLSVNWADDRDYPLFWVYLPVARGNGHHRKIIDSALCGLTVEKERKWHNAYLFPERKEDYEEWCEWHNTTMVELGYDPVPSYEANLFQLHFGNLLNFESINSSYEGLLHGFKVQLKVALDYAGLTYEDLQDLTPPATQGDIDEMFLLMTKFSSIDDENSPE